MTSQLEVVEETRVPDETTAYLQVTGNFLTCHGRDSNLGSGERQLAIGGNALGHTAISVGSEYQFI